MPTGSSELSSLQPNLKTWLLLLKHVDLGYQNCSTVHLLWFYQIAKCRVANGTYSNGLKHFLRIRETVEKGLRHLFISSSSYHFFKKPILSSISYGKKVFLFKKPTKLFQYWKLSTMQLSIQLSLAKIRMKFSQQMNNNDKAYFRLYNKHEELLPHQNISFQKYLIFFAFNKFRNFRNLLKFGNCALF